MATRKAWFLGSGVALVVLLVVGVVAFLWSERYLASALPGMENGPVGTTTVPAAAALPGAKGQSLPGRWPTAVLRVEPLGAVEWTPNAPAVVVAKRLSGRDVLEEALSPGLPGEVAKFLDAIEQTEPDEAALKDRTGRIQQAKAKLLGEKDPVGALQKLVVVHHADNALLVEVAVRVDDPRMAADLANSAADSVALSFRRDRDNRDKSILNGLKKQKMELQPALDEAERQLRIIKREIGVTSLSAQSSMSVDESAKMDKFKKLADQYEKARTEVRLLDEAIARQQIGPGISVDFVTVASPARVAAD